MAASAKHALPLSESDLAVNFYAVARDYPKEVFGQITRRVLGPKGFAVLPQPEAFQRECQRMFDLAHTK